LEWGSFTRDSERHLKKDSGNGTSLNYGSSVRGTWRGGSFTGDPDGYVKEGSGNRHLSSWGPHWGTMEGTLFDWGL
jgi:hypothetical protein